MDVSTRRMATQRMDAILKLDAYKEDGMILTTGMI